MILSCLVATALTEGEIRLGAAQDSPDLGRSVSFDHKQIVVRDRGKPDLKIRLSEENADRLAKAATAIDPRHRSGVWVQHGILDGIIVIGRLKIDDAQTEFIGVNGCPPGFTAFAKLLDEVSGKAVFGGGWQTMEEASEHFESLADAASGNAAKGAKKKD